MTLGLQSPPKLVRLFRAVDTFDRNVSNKILKNLVTRLHLSKHKTGTQARLPANDSAKSIRPLLPNNIIVAAMNAKTDSSSQDATQPAIPQAIHDDEMIVSSTREKRRILDAYDDKIGTGYTDSIVTRKKGKQVDTTLLSRSKTQRMRPSKDKFYRVDILELHSVIATILKNF